MKIVIPSLGRAGSANSMKWLKDTSREVVFAVHTDEIEAYQKAYPGTKWLGLSDASRKHTGLVRKEIMDYYKEPFIFVDDDIRVSLKTVTSIDKMFDQLEFHIHQGASMAGLAPQLFSNFAKTELINGDLCAVRNKFVATVYAINPLHFDTCPLQDLPVYEDIALCIHAIKYGGGTIVTYSATHSNVSPPSGGCNSWRNEIITIQSLQKLCELYPDVCSIKETKNKTHSQDIGIGLKTEWKKIKKVN